MKLAFIAMSGVRVVDQELLQLGLNLPGFVERSEVIASLPSLGLLTLAGMTPGHHEVSYLEIADLSGLDEIKLNADLAAISTFSAQIFEAYELADRLRAAGIRVVMGGPHVSVLPEEALRHADCVVIGEGESVWPQVLADAEAGKLEPLYGQINGPFDLAQAPMPAFELLEIGRYNRLTVQTHRGCPHRCEFCAASPMLTHRYKQKPIEKVLAEIDRICELWDFPFIEFADDNSMVNKAYWRALCSELAKRRVRWFTETDISVAQDSDLLQLMRKAGCAQILIGLESPSDAGLAQLETKRDWKRKQLEHYKSAVREIQSHGITVNGCFILGLDGQGEDIFDTTFEFVRESELYEVQITVLTPFPGTPLYDRLKRENRLLEDGRWDKCTLFDINYQPTHMTPEALRAGLMSLSQRLYSREFTTWRRDRFKERLRSKLHAPARTAEMEASGS